jgi:pimeloyl-ACP methyl ester carboxylesterase
VRVDEHTIDIAGMPVFYRAAPTGGFPVLYLHGVPTSSDDWSPFLEHIGGIAPDLIGFGRSAKAGNLDYSIPGLAAFVERLLEYLGIEAVSLVAHDWGAAVALTLAQRQSDRVNRLVLCNALPLLEGFRWYRIARWWRRAGAGELIMGSTTRRLLARELRRGSVREGAWDDERIEAVWRQFDQGTQRAILRLYRASPEAQLAQAGAALERIEAPCLVIWGERDPWLPAEIGELYVRRLPHARLERIAEAGHWPWLDRPEVLALVSEFLG